MPGTMEVVIGWPEDRDWEMSLRELFLAKAATQASRIDLSSKKVSRSVEIRTMATSN